MKRRPTALVGAILLLGGVLSASFPKSLAGAAAPNSAPAADEISGLVWLDTDGDGVNDIDPAGDERTDLDGDGRPDAVESGFDGALVTLRDSTGAVVATQTTGSNGWYSFTGLPGAYTGPFSVEVRTDPAVWAAPSNWSISGTPFAG